MAGRDDAPTGGGGPVAAGSQPAATRADREHGAAATRVIAARDLRQRATSRAGAVPADDVESMSPGDLGKLVHELRVHQIELEMQNDELREAQLALEASRSRYFDLYDLAPIGYVTIDAGGRITEANLAAAAMLGAVRSQLVGRPFTRCILPDDQDLLYFHRRRVAIASAPLACELRLVRVDGSTLWVRLEERLAADPESGEPVSRATLSDITASVAASDERALLQEQLAEAQRLELVGRLAGGVAHDLNNMLQVILASADFALEQVGPDDPLRADLEPIRDAGRRSSELTAQLLAYARRQVASPQVVDLNGVVATALRLIRRIMREDLVVDWRPAAGLRATYIDPSQVTRILTNLCVNSRDAIDGPGRITVSTANVDVADEDPAAPDGARPGSWVVISVTDTGHGMEADVLEHVFEPFYTTKEAAPASGLGLASVDGIARQNGGFVAAASAPGVGSTFTVYLPRAGDGGPIGG